MDEPPLVETLLRYLQADRDLIISKLDGLSEYDQRRPMTPTGTNLLGLVKHLLSNEVAYLLDALGRPFEPKLSWDADGSVWEGADMWATPEESSDDLVALYRQISARGDANVRELGLDAPAVVGHWKGDRRNTTVGHLVVRMLDETARHAGHADIVREMIDGAGGSDQDDMGDTAYWTEYRAKLQAAADVFRG